MAQSAELTKFYQDYLRWAENYVEMPTEEEDTGSWSFDPGVGLCSNLYNWIAMHSTSDEGFSELLSKLRTEMLEQFRANNLNVLTPFNGMENPYHADMQCYKNPARIAWVRAHANFSEEA